MLEIWDARPVDQKFTIVCIVHNAGPNFWYPVLPDWSKRGAIRFLSIADQYVILAYVLQYHDLIPSSASDLASRQSLRIKLVVQILLSLGTSVILVGLPADRKTGSKTT